MTKRPKGKVRCKVCGKPVDAKNARWLMLLLGGVRGPYCSDACVERADR